MKFRKKPVIVDAFQLTERYFARNTVMDFAEVVIDYNLRVARIFTPEGIMTAKVGDWIIRGVAGEVYPCKPDIFERTYEPAEPLP